MRGLARRRGALSCVLAAARERSARRARTADSGGGGPPRGAPRQRPADSRDGRNALVDLVSNPPSQVATGSPLAGVAAPASDDCAAPPPRPAAARPPYLRPRGSSLVTASTLRPLAFGTGPSARPYSTPTGAGVGAGARGRRGGGGGGGGKAATTTAAGSGAAAAATTAAGAGGGGSAAAATATAGAASGVGAAAAAVGGAARGVADLSSEPPSSSPSPITDATALGGEADSTDPLALAALAEDVWPTTRAFQDVYAAVAHGAGSGIAPGDDGSGAGPIGHALQALLGPEGPLSLSGFEPLGWVPAVVGTSLAFRLAVTFPLHVFSMRNAARLAAAKSDIEAASSSAKAAMREAQERGSGQDAAEVAKRGQEKVQAVLKRHGARPLAGVAASVVSLFAVATPFRAAYTLALADPAVPSLADPSAVPRPLAALGVESLTLPDSTYLLPAATTLAMLVAVELSLVEAARQRPAGAGGAGAALLDPTAMRTPLRIIIPVMGILVFRQMPALLHCLMLGNTAFQVAQSRLMLMPSFRKAAGLPSTETLAAERERVAAKAATSGPLALLVPTGGRLGAGVPPRTAPTGEGGNGLAGGTGMGAALRPDGRPAAPRGLPPGLHAQPPPRAPAADAGDAAPRGSKFRSRKRRGR